MWRVSLGLMSVGFAVSRVAGEPLYASSTSESAAIAYFVRRGRYRQWGLPVNGDLRPSVTSNDHPSPFAAKLPPMSTNATSASPVSPS